MSKLQAEQLAAQFEFTLTALRKDVLNLLIQAKKPLGAYDILEKLKKIRPTAAPPTVYRVLDFLVEQHLVHRLDSSHMYVLCEHHAPHKNAILFNCKACAKALELVDLELAKHFVSLGAKHNIQIENHLIEVSGYCAECRKA